MSQKTFEVVFSGKLVEGAAPQKVKANVAALFKVEVAKVERLFSGATVSIKKGLDEATAKKYQLALHRAGAITRVINRAAAPPTSKAAPARPTQAKPAAQPRRPAPAAKPATGKAAAGVGLQKSVVKQAPSGVGEFAAAQIDAPGTVLVKHQEIPPPQIDTSSLSMDQSGAELVKHERIPEPEFDLGGLSMGAEGEALGQETPFEPLEVDVSNMSMDEAGVTLVEHEETPVPKIDTSNLSLD